MTKVMVEQRLVEHLRGEIAALEAEVVRLRGVTSDQADELAGLKAQQRPLDLDAMRAVREGRLI